jgi:23S rRNA (cytosine1962-C5)-methyltransferase
MQTWRLSKPGEKRFRTGHPWVFSNELLGSPKEIQAGALIKLIDHDNKFLATGYGHPNSLISFRVLSYRDENIDANWFLSRILQAAKLRSINAVDRQGDKYVSHRLVFAEADQLPGLVIDRYPLYSGEADVFVAQTSTAGMDRMWPEIFKAI